MLSHGLYSFDKNSDGSGNLAGTQAAGAYVNGLGGAVYDSLHLSDVGLPGSFGSANRERYVVSESNCLSADAAFCHDIFLLEAAWSLSRQQYFIINRVIIPHNFTFCKGFCKIL